MSMSDSSHGEAAAQSLHVPGLRFTAESGSKSSQYTGSNFCNACMLRAPSHGRTALSRLSVVCAMQGGEWVPGMWPPVRAPPRPSAAPREPLREPRPYFYRVQVPRSPCPPTDMFLLPICTPSAL